MQRLVVQQPQFLAWVGFWNKVASATRFVAYAGAQFEPGGHQNRVKIGGSWLTVPVETGSMFKAHKDVRIAGNGWTRKAVRTIRENCMSKRMPYRDRLDPLITRLENWTGDYLLDLNVVMTVQLSIILGLDTELLVDTGSREGERIAKLDECLAQYAGPETAFLQGAAGAGYLKKGDLKNVAEVWYQRVTPGQNENSIVQSIAQIADPLTLVRECAVWTGEDGRTYDWKGLPT
jgi:hypothetical protein